MFEVVLGVIGNAGHGKDSCASVLQEEFGFSRLALADNLKKDIYMAFEGFPECSLQAQNSRGRDPWVRRLQQVYGTEWCRNRLGEDFWLDRWSVQAKRWFDFGTKAIVVPGVRFPNELNYLSDKWGARFLFVERPGYQEPGVDPEHDSEKFVRGLKDKADIFIVNSGDLNQLRDSVVSHMEVHWKSWDI